MKLENIKIGMMVKIAKITEDPTNYEQYIGTISKVVEVTGRRIKLAFDSGECWYPEELEPIEKKKIKMEDLIL